MPSSTRGAGEATGSATGTAGGETNQLYCMHRLRGLLPVPLQTADSSLNCRMLHAGLTAIDLKFELRRPAQMSGRQPYITMT